MKKIICFVKTPGYSPLKTRLAKSIGQQMAEEFYVRSLSVIKQTLLRLKEDGYTPIFAVAEKEALDSNLWQGFQVTWQGEGGLGDRLSHVFQEEFSLGDEIFFIGGDCPQFIEGDLFEASKSLKSSGFVLGPTEDGGYWLFGAKEKVSERTWTDVLYSADSTFAQFKTLLLEIAPVAEAKKYNDVDFGEDLVHLYLHLSNRQELCQTKLELMEWLSGPIGMLE